MSDDRLRALLAELHGQTCRCGATKQVDQTFCKTCYYTLPMKQRQNLYLLLGAGYERAYDEAVQTLDGRNESTA